MRKIKKVTGNDFNIKYSDAEVVFYGIIGVIKKAIADYLFLIANNTKFTINYTASTTGSPLKALENALLISSNIASLCKKQTWNDRELLLVRSKIKEGYPFLESIFDIATIEHIKSASIYHDDYDLITTLITTREYLRSEQHLFRHLSSQNLLVNHYISLEVFESLKKLISMMSRIINFYLDEIYFGNPPKPKSVNKDIIPIEVFINDAGILINKKGYYSAFTLKDEEDNHYCAGITTEGKLYILDSDSSYILNKNGLRLKWRICEKRKEDRLVGLYKFGEHEIVTNMRRFNYDTLVQECKEAGISNVNIFKTLIEMSGFSVG